jgi:hypothetical protein
MAGAQKGFYWKADTLNAVLRRNVKAFPVTLDRAVTAAVEYQATKAETYMRTRASWTDRTGNARNGLHTSTQHQAMHRHRIICAHGVSYGIWLEVRFSGRYSIVPETVQVQGKELMALIGGLLGRLGT